MRERSLQSPKMLHSARDVLLQFFRNRQMQDHEVFDTLRQFRLSDYMKCYFCWPKFGCRFVDVSAQDASGHGCMYSRIQAIISIFTAVSLIMTSDEACKRRSGGRGVTIYIYIYIYMCILYVYIYICYPLEIPHGLA